ncbi:MAG TPA: hypothetical protein VIY47_15730 [Ignavibacteriaceae bacterium]
MPAKKKSAPKKKKAISKKATTRTKFIYHKDGSLWGKGKIVSGKMEYWEWYRKDGIIMRSGYLEGDKQVGEWITYDKTGKVYKVTKMKP